MKAKIIYLFLLFFLSFGITSCGDDSPDSGGNGSENTDNGNNSDGGDNGDGNEDDGGGNNDGGGNDDGSGNDDGDDDNDDGEDGDNENEDKTINITMEEQEMKDDENIVEF